MNKALGEIPLTVKLRTGVKDGRNTAHKIMPIFGPSYGVGAASVLSNTSKTVEYAEFIMQLLATWTITTTEVHEVSGLELYQGMR